MLANFRPKLTVTAGGGEPLFRMRLGLIIIVLGWSVPGWTSSIDPDSVEQVMSDLYKQGVSDKASESCIELVAHYKEVGDELHELFYLIKLAEIQRSGRNYEYAERTLQNVLSRLLESGDSFLLAKTHNRLASVYFEGKNFDLSRQALQESQFYCTDKSSSIKISNLALEGVLLREKKKYKEAAKAFLTSLSYATEVHDTDNMVNACLNMGYLFRQMSDSNEMYGDSVLHYATIAYDLIREAHLTVRLQEAFVQIAYAYEELKDFEKAYQYHVMYLNERDRVQKRSMQRHVDELSAKYESERVMSENRALEEKNRMGQILFWSVLAALVMSGAALFQLIVSRRKTVKTNKKLGELNQRVKKQNNRLQNLLKDRETILSMVAHDLRGPINSLNSVLRLYNSGNLSAEEQNQLLSQLEARVNGISDLLENLLTWSKSQLEGIIVEIVTVEIRSLVEEVVVAIMYLAEQKGISVQNRLDQVELQADRNMIQLVIRNLLSNAIKFTPSGGTVLVHGEKTDLGYMIMVEDTGVGIRSDRLNSIFKEFGDHTVGTDNEKGSGLGLAMCKQFVELNKGKIGVESTFGLGSRFWFTLPA